MELERDELLDLYRRYLERCNEHRVDGLGEYVADDVNGPREGLSAVRRGRCSPGTENPPDGRQSRAAMAWAARRAPSVSTGR